MNAIATLLDGPFADALGRALVHLVWQASAVALLLAGALAAMRRAGSDARYAVSCIALALTVALPVATAYVTYDPAPSHAAATALAPSAALPAAGMLETPADSGLLRAAAALPLDPALPWIVLAWLAGVTLLSARIGVALVSARRLADSGIDTLPREWRATLARLTEAMGIARAVRLLESSRVDVPTVVGWLRPVILVPASALTGLTPQQLETVLAHELAHIRRHDFVVNLAQTVVETLFFYHPAVWWISGRIRAEREHCCDDAAVALCGDALGYARALATLEEMRSARVPATALASTGGSLLQRVRRLVGLSSDELGSTRPIAALIALSIVTAAIAIPLSARAGRSGEASGTTITVDAAREEDDAVTGIFVAKDDDDPFAYAFEAAELAAAQVELQRAEIERQLAAIDRQREEIDHAMALARAARDGAREGLEAERDAIEGAIAEAAIARETAEAHIAAILEGMPPAPPAPEAPVARPAQPAPPAPPAGQGRWVWPEPAPTPRVAPMAPVAPEPAIAPVAPVTPVAPVAPLPAPFVRGIEGSGKPVDPDKPDVDDLVVLHSAGIDAAYVRSLRDAGLGGLTARQLVMLESAGVDAAYVRSMTKATGRQPGWSQLLRLRASGVDEEAVAELRAKGEAVTVDRLLRARTPEIDRAELERMRAELARSRGELERARRDVLEVDAGYVAALERAGLTGLTKREYGMLKMTGVDADWVRDVRAAGYRNFSASELVGLHASGVDGDYLRELAGAGFRDLSASQLMRLHASGISADDLREWKK